MKLQFQVNDRVTVEAEGDSVKDLFTQIHALVESFGTSTCGCCGENDIVPVARKNGKFTFYEFKCRTKGCGAKMSMGVKDDGSIYPRRKVHADSPLIAEGKAKEGDWLPDNGWTRWTKEKK